MKANSHSNITKLAFDFYTLQMKWATWYLIIVTAISVFVPMFLSGRIEGDISWSVLQGIYSASKIYLFVVAIILCFAMIGFMVKSGVTRRDYFYGTAIASVGVSFSIIIIGALITFIIDLIGLKPYDPTLRFLNSDSTWLLPIISLSLILTSYYLAGWIVAAGYYRFGGVKTVGFVGITLVFVSMIDLLWEGEISYPIISIFDLSLTEFPALYSIVLTLILIGLALWLVRIITKRTPIKIE